MIYKGYKIRVRCINWEQVDVINNYWNFFASRVGYQNIVGLGMNWTEDNLYFDYAIGTINQDDTLEKIKTINFPTDVFQPEYFEIQLPDFKDWKTFKGLDDRVQEIYDKEIDCYCKEYDYELEYLDGMGNIEIKIHFI